MKVTMEQIPGFEFKLEVETDNVTKLCFICLNRNAPFHHNYREKSFQSKFKLLTSYILQNPSPFSTEDNGERNNELQRNILSSLNARKWSVCEECLWKAERLMDLHLELEKVQMQILDVLRNLQDHLKCSRRDGLGIGVLGTHSSFQNVLTDQFMHRKLSDGTEVRLHKLNNAGYSQYLISGNTESLELESTEENDEFENRFDDYDSFSGEATFSENAEAITSRAKDPTSRRKSVSIKAKRSTTKTTRLRKPRKLQYECDICYKVTPHKDMEHHLSTHPQFEKFYKCDICPDTDRSKIFGSYKGLIWHYLRAKHDVQMPCNLCSDQSILLPLDDLCVHLYNFHQLNHKKLLCGLEHCLEEFCDPVTRNKHRYCSCKYISNYKTYACELCQITFETRHVLRRHNSQQHEKEELFKFKQNPEDFAQDIVKCSQCCKNVLRKYLDSHIEAMHNNGSVGEFICNFCKLQFKLRSRLQSHIKLIHTDGKGELFVCDECPKEFKTCKSLQAHKKQRHVETDLVVCPHCPLTFLQYRLNQHIKRVHGDRTFRCGFCTKTFTTKRSLKCHEEAHMDERKYKCEECEFSSNTEQALRTHKAVHKEKTIQCQYCPLMFSTNAYLRKHERKHTNERPFKCAVCPQMFTHTNTRVYHEMKMHGITANRIPAPVKVKAGMNDVKSDG